jgi:IgA Peptidase M64/CARDB
MRRVTHGPGVLALVLAAGLSVVAGELEAADSVTSVRLTGDSSNRVDIVVLGDGYTAGELGQYAADVETFLDGFFFATPFAEYARYFNVHRIDVESPESGADHPNRTPAVFRDTALDATYDCAGIQRLICVNLSKVNAVLASVSPDMRDVVLVLVNDPEYGGSGGAVAVASTHPAVVELVLHETGHSFGLLADEYGGPPPPQCNTSREPVEPNVTRVTERDFIKWGAWIDAETPIPTFSPIAGLPGLYEGAGYCDVGLFRPTYDSRMRSLFRPFEQINSEQLVKRVYNWVTPIDLVVPEEGSIQLSADASQTFRVQLLDPLTHSLEVVWSVDGVQAGSGDEFTLNARDLTSGSHTVGVVVSDLTSLVRNDPAGVLTDSHTWEVEIASATLGPDLIQAALSNPPIRIRAGKRFTVVDTVQNAGDTSAASTKTSYYLSLDRDRDEGDRRLARTRIVAELSPGESSEGSTQVRVPPGLAPGRYFLLACADSEDTQVESVETNNCRASDTRVRVRIGW